MIFMPSSNTPVTLVFRYCLTGAPWTGASVGIVKAESGCAEAARERSPPSPLATELAPLRTGVLTRAGIGDGALLCDWA